VRAGVPNVPGGPVIEWTPPTREDIEKLLAIAPKYGIEIRLPH
jgi:hypothetical protein